MGEAKRRKETDATYGRPKYGVVVSVPMEIKDTTVSIRASGLDDQELRSSLLFFDKIAWPDSNIIGFHENDDIKFLMGCNILSRPRVVATNGDAAELMAMGHIACFKTLDSQEPRMWSLAQGENSFLWRNRNIETDTGTMLELIRAIPVPDKEVPLNEILKFKRRRSDEVYNLRSELQLFVSRVDSADDKESEIRDSVQSIDKSCTDLLRVCGEWQFPVRLSNLKSYFDFGPWSIAAGTLAASRFSLGLSASYLDDVLTAGVGTVASAIRVRGDFGWKGLKHRDNPYRYVSQFHRELF